MKKNIEDHLVFLYGKERGKATLVRLKELLAGYRNRISRPHNIPERPLPLDERDSIVITYGDQFRKKGENPLATLKGFFDSHVGNAVSGIHILPFSPYSSDDGFSVIDYRQVNPDFGTWDDIKRISGKYRLMADLVLNHISARSKWFREFLKGNEKYRDYFIVVPEGADLSKVVRPRALPLLTEFDTPWGKKKLWTTFSEDQIDLNYKNPDLLLEMIDIMLMYVEMGAQVIRLDAIAYLWKEFGTTCIHLEQTHRVVQLFRSVLGEVAPWVVIITETNVPHEENISYFGNGYNEAQMVYQFSLPPLVLDAFRRGEANHLTEWASTLGQIEGDVTFFNFLASHDGVGVLPAHGILSEKELEGLVELALSKGGYVSYKATPEGEIPYELNISYYDAISKGEKTTDLRVKKFLSSQSIMLALKGIPGIYVHSLLATPNYREGVERTGVKRSINRKKFEIEEVETHLNDNDSEVKRVFDGYLALLRARRGEKAFDPLGKQEILEVARQVFAVLRFANDGGSRVLCLTNTSRKQCQFGIDVSALNIRGGPSIGKEDMTSERGSFARDIISGKEYSIKKGQLIVDINGYDTLWLRF